MRKLSILLALVAGLFISEARADFTGKNAAAATITFKNPGDCTSVVCVPVVQIYDGTNLVTLTTAGADAVSNTLTGVPVYSRVLFFNGTTWDRWQGAVTATLAAETTKVIGTVRGAASGFADGWSVTDGAIADAAATAGSTGSHAAKLRLVTTQLQSIITALGSPFQAGGSLAANQSMNVSQINGVTPLMGNGATGTGSPRVTLSNDNTIPTGWPTAANQSSQITQETAINTVLGTTADAACGTATGTCSLIALQKFANSTLAAQILDPCQTVATISTRIDIAAAATTVLVAGTSAKKTYICGMMLFSAGTTNVGIVEGSGTTCGTSTLGLIGGNTAAKGPNLTAQAGFNSPPTGYRIAGTTVNANDICLINSAAVQVSGYIVTATP